MTHDEAILETAKALYAREPVIDGEDDGDGRNGHFGAVPWDKLLEYDIGARCQRAFIENATVAISAYLTARASGPDAVKMVSQRAVDLLNRMANMTDPRTNTAGAEEELEAFAWCIKNAQAIAAAFDAHTQEE